MPTVTVEPLVFDVQTAAKVISVSPSMIRKLISEGKLSAAKVGDRVLIRRQSLEQLVGV